MGPGVYLPPLVCCFMVFWPYVMRYVLADSPEAFSDEVPLKELRSEVSLLKTLALVQLGGLFISVTLLTAVLVLGVSGNLNIGVLLTRVRHGFGSFGTPLSAP